jgi:hypothetical protein
MPYDVPAHEPVDAKLDLLQAFLVDRGDVAECAQRAVDWLIHHGQVERAVFAYADSGRLRVPGLAGAGPWIAPSIPSSRCCINTGPRRSPAITEPFPRPAGCSAARRSPR